MANAITSQTLVGGATTVVKINIVGDGSGEESETVIFDSTNFGNRKYRIMSIRSAFAGAVADLLWAGTPNVYCCTIPEGDAHQCFREFGGLVNNATAKNGDILLSTTGLGNGDAGTIILVLERRNG